MKKSRCLLLMGFLISFNLFAVEKSDAPFEISIKTVSFPEKYYSIEDFGAHKGGVEKCTLAFSKAIEKATKEGGGYVTIPKGKWLVGPIVLKDNVCLKLEEGAEILFSTDPDDYLPAVLSRHQGIDCYKFSSFIYANNATNIGIIGKGILNGQGMTWMKYRNAIPKDADPNKILFDMAERGVPVEERIFNDVHKTLLPPCFIMPINCRKILIEEITVKYGAFWTVNPVYCQDIIIRNVTVETKGEYGSIGNGDGIILSSCKNVIVEKCRLNTGDDCIILKSGRGIDGYKRGIPSENIVIRNCKSFQGHGGVVVGSETSGGIRNIYVHDCVFNGTDRGVRIKTARGRGDAIENMWFENIQMGKMINEAILIIMTRYTPRYPAFPLTRMTPRIRNINFKNITCKEAEQNAIWIQGLPEIPIESITMESVTILSEKGVMLMDAASVVMKNMDIRTQDDTIMTFDNCPNIIIDRLAETDKKVLVIGDGSKDIRFIDSNINKGNIQYKDCNKKVSLLNSKPDNINSN